MSTCEKKDISFKAASPESEQVETRHKKSPNEILY